MHKKNIHLLQTDTHAAHTTFTNIHARTHAHILNKNVPAKRSNRNWKQIPCAPQNLPKFSLQVSFSSFSFTSTGQSIFSCCWRSQVRPCAAAINAPCPTGDYRHHRVSQQPSIAKKTSPSTTETPPRASGGPKSNKKEKKLKKESVRCLHVVSPKPAFACKHAPAHLSTRQITSVGRPRTSTPSAPHVHTNFSGFSRTRRETCARAVATLPKSRPN